MTDKAIPAKAEQNDQIAGLINSLSVQDWEKSTTVQAAARTAPPADAAKLTLNGDLPKGVGDPNAQSVVIVDETAHKTHVLQMQNGTLKDVLTVPDSVGKSSTPTPMQRWEVSDKRLDPVWYPPASIGGHPVQPYKITHHNPIGLAFIRLDGTSFGLHGTNRPDQIGKSVSHGCMRHNNEDIMRIFPLVQKGTAVYTVKHFDGANIRVSDFDKKH